MNLVAYVRVSTQRQANEGVSLRDQEARIRAWCDMHDHVLVRVYEEAASARGGKRRPVFDAAIRDALLVDGIVVYDLDRMFRSLLDALLVTKRLRNAGRALYAVAGDVDTSTADGRFVLHMKYAMAERESDQIGERTARGMQRAIAEGRRVGRQRALYDPVLVAEVQSVVEATPSRRAAARTLSARRGEAWDAAKIRRVLREQI